jgi:hypothetical protein
MKFAYTVQYQLKSKYQSKLYLDFSSIRFALRDVVSLNDLG